MPYNFWEMINEPMVLVKYNREREAKTWHNIVTKYMSSFLHGEFLSARNGNNDIRKIENIEIDGIMT